MTLYEIDAEILDCIDEETGEVIDLERLRDLQMERDKKIHNVACWYKSLVAEAEAIKTEKQKLAKRQQVCENKAESLKDFLSYALNGQKFKDGAVAISYRRSEGIHFAEDFDGNTLPKEFLRIKAEPKLTEIKEAIKAGQEFKGISLIEKSNIQIR